MEKDKNSAAKSASAFCRFRFFLTQGGLWVGFGWKPNGGLRMANEEKHGQAELDRATRCGLG